MTDSSYQNILSKLDLAKLDALSNNRPLLEAYVRERVSQALDSPAPPPILSMLVKELTGLGALEPLLENPDITEIMVNAHDQIYVEISGQLSSSALRFSCDMALRHVLNRLISFTGRRIDDTSPMVDARLADGSRLNAIISPIALNGTCLTIRKFKRQLMSLSDLVSQGSLSQRLAQELGRYVSEKKNILVAGGTGTGKTTLLNCLSSVIPEHERIITLEDAAELCLSKPHVIRLESRPANVEGKGNIPIRDLLRNALRMRPDRVIVGECRGSEVIDMLQAMNTGHEGSMSTVHANSPRDALYRLENMVLMSGIDLPLRAIRDQIASSLHLIVFLKRDAHGRRRVHQVSHICGIEGEVITLRDLYQDADRASAHALERPL